MKKILWILLIVGIVIFGIKGFKDRQSAIAPAEAKKVTVAIAQDAQTVVQNDLSSFVRNEKQAMLAAQVGGVLEQVYVKEGDYVKRGQILARVSIPDIAAKYQQATTALNIAQQEEQKARSRKTVGQRWYDLSPETREQYKLSTQLARGTQQEVAGLISRSYIKAPFDGIVSQKFADNGDTVFLTNDIFEIVGSANKKEVILEVSPTVVKNVANGDKVEVSDGLYTTQGTVVAVGPATDKTSRKNTVRIALEQTAPYTLGTFVTVTFNDKNIIEGVQVPKDAIVKVYEDTFAFVVDAENIVHMKKINTIASVNEGSEWFIEGVDSGERVVTSKTTHIQDGETVIVVE
jgi:multidrug efflux system membrane fusion protein